jgi:multicomponent Na+:H+ antiporter subunit G
MKQIILYTLILGGSFFVLVAAIGLLRFRELYSRMHATTKATSFGILLLVAGAGLHFASWEVAIKAVLVILFVYLTAPLAAHSIARSVRRDDDDVT